LAIKLNIHRLKVNTYLPQTKETIMLKHITTDQLTLSLADIEQQITQRKALINQAQTSISKLERIQKTSVTSSTP
jgi:hypothetical protein